MIVGLSRFNIYECAYSVHTWIHDSVNEYTFFSAFVNNTGPNAPQQYSLVNNDLYCEWWQSQCMLSSSGAKECRKQASGVLPKTQIRTRAAATTSWTRVNTNTTSRPTCVTLCRCSYCVCQAFGELLELREQRLRRAEEARTDVRLRRQVTWLKIRRSMVDQGDKMNDKHEEGKWDWVQKDVRSARKACPVVNRWA